MRKKDPLFYTLCFCIKKREILMIYRKKDPYKFNWNGVGGKIEPGETPLEALYREVKEEAILNLKKADSLKYCGILTRLNKNEKDYKRIYTFIAYFNSSNILSKRYRSREGVLEWKSLKWVCDKRNRKVVDNVPYFLPNMIKKSDAFHYFCEYKEEILKKINICPLLEDYLNIDKKLKK